MTKSTAQLDAEIAEALRAKKWQEQVEREDRERRARLARAASSPMPEQLYEEHAADLAAGVFHGERRGRARQFRKVASAAEAIQWSEAAKQASDEAHSAADHRAAVAAHRKASRLHKTDPTGAEVAWLHDLAASNHRQVAKVRDSRTLTHPEQRNFTAYQEKLREAMEHQYMAMEYARQALAAARQRA